MKYIRTERGHIIDMTICIAASSFFDPIKEADTIQELCDEFVYVGEKGNVVLGMSYMQMEDVKKYNVNKNQIFGAIWTKGKYDEPILKSVAKMNDKGELELL